MDKLQQTIVSLAVENCELRQALKEAESTRDQYRTWWLDEKGQKAAETIEREG